MVQKGVGLLTISVSIAKSGDTFEDFVDFSIKEYEDMLLRKRIGKL
jgi:hypothetical protein